MTPEQLAQRLVDQKLREALMALCVADETAKDAGHGDQIRGVILEAFRSVNTALGMLK